jgi:hypothetical protein
MTQLETKVSRVEDLIRDLSENSGLHSALMREHLEEARFYLLGSMPAEYALTTELAGKILPEIQDPDLHKRIEEFLREPYDSGD